MKTVYDVIIVGAGPGGSAAAYYLNQAGLDVLLLDKSEFPRDKTCGDGLTPRALHVLSDMGVLEHVEQIGFNIKGIEIHGRKGNRIIAPIPTHETYPDHLVIAPRLKLDHLLLEKAISKKIEFQSSVRVTGIENKNDKVVVRSSLKGVKIEYWSRLVIVAVGANINLLQKIGVLKVQPEMILAARGYYEGLEGLSDRIEAHFEDVPLPGYGWGFPISKTSANIGLGYWKSRFPWKKPPSSARTAMKDWLSKSGHLSRMMKNSSSIGQIKGYPLRVDFQSAPTQLGRILLVGEAAGLVSPLTGEGIDFALESSKLAAAYIVEMFEKGDFSNEEIRGYDSMLRKHFQKLFIFLARIRQIYVNPTLMNKYILATKRYPELKDLLIRVLLSQAEASELVNFSVIRKIVFGI